jgi:mRNA-degrading endonuclease RelE of RelBE toxin-antitoxin system
MKSITMIETYDKEIHPTIESAIKHLDKEYGKILLELTRKICDLMFQEGPAISKVSDYLDNHLEEFHRLRIIKKDMDLIEEKEE